MVTDLGTGIASFSWSLRSFQDPYEVVYPINAKSGKAGGVSTGYLSGKVTVVANGVTVRTFNSAGTLVDGTATVVLY